MNEPPKTIYEVLKFLRAPNGCPWDRVQTSKSVSTCMKEECAEVLEAIDLEDDELLCEELGDLLMNIVFQAVIAEEKGAFTWEDVQSHVTEKMIRRHAHVFGEFEAENPEEVLKLWEKIKAIEKKHRKNDSILDNIAPEIPALDYAEKIQKKVAKYGFDWENQAQIIEKIEEELNELKSAMAANNDAEIDEELGDLLFSLRLKHFFAGFGSAHSLSLFPLCLRFGFHSGKIRLVCLVLSLCTFLHLAEGLP